MTAILFTNNETNQAITVTPASGFAAADILLINTDDYTVTLNERLLIIPDIFRVCRGGNDFKFRIWSQAHNVDLRLIYRDYFYDE